jgi:hypothetical protein
MPPAFPPQILQIVREPLQPGSRAAYAAIEEDSARAAATLGCPHPYLGAESVTGSPEVWWFNGFDSRVEQTQVAADYAKNAPLMAALQQNSARKASLTLAPIEALATFRPELTVGAPWIPGAGRFLVIVVTTGESAAGTAFETADGVRFIVTPAQTRDAADAIQARAAAAESYLLAVRPSWSFPAKQWIAEDPGFWQL